MTEEERETDLQLADAVAMLDAMKQKIRALEQACELYDAALKASCPDGAKGEVRSFARPHHQWSMVLSKRLR